MTGNLRAARLIFRSAHYQEIPLPATDFSNPSRLSSGLRYGFFETTAAARSTGCPEGSGKDLARIWLGRVSV